MTKNRVGGREVVLVGSAQLNKTKLGNIFPNMKMDYEHWSYIYIYDERAQQNHWNFPFLL